MADINRTQERGVPETMVTKYRDQEDGTHALVGTSRIERRTVVETATIPNNQSMLDRWIDFRYWAAIAIQFPEAMTGTHFQIYGRIEQAGTEEKAVYDDTGAIITQEIDNGIVLVTADVFVLPWIKIQSCSAADGTPQAEGAARTIKIVKKP